MRLRPEAPRISPAAHPSPEVASLLERVAGGPAEHMVRTLANHERALQGLLAFGSALAPDGLLPRRAMFIVVQRVAWNCQSVYQFGVHWALATSAGLTDDEVAALAGGSVDDFIEDERALIAFADEFCADDCVSDETWKQLASTWSKEELIELTLVAGMCRMVSAFVNTTGIQREPGVPGWPEA